MVASAAARLDPTYAR